MTNNYKAWDIDIELPDTSDWRAFIEKVVSFGILAGNSHNTQPWLFVADETNKTLEVFVNKESILAVSDVDERQAVMSVGCAIENIEIAANSYGFIMHMQIETQKRDSNLLAVLHFEKDNITHTKLRDAILTRRVNRSKCISEKTIPAHVMEEFCSVSNAAVDIHFISETGAKNTIADLQEQADRFVLGNEAFRKELGDWLLPNNTESFIGMPGNTFGLRDEQSVKISDQLKEGKLDYDLASGVAVSDRERIRTCQFVCVVAADDTREGWVHVGRTWQRLALIAETHGISVAVSAALIEVVLLNRILKDTINAQKKPLLLSTFGYASEETPHSPRMSASEVLTFRQ